MVIFRPKLAAPAHDNEDYAALPQISSSSPSWASRSGQTLASHCTAATH